MDLNIFKNNSQSEHKNFIKSFAQDLRNFLNNPKNNSEYKNDFFTIDRFEENFAVCQNRRTNEFFNIPKSEIPVDAKEGIIIKVENNSYVIAYEETRIQKEQMQDLINKAIKHKP